jgi:hypothetical protein
LGSDIITHLLGANQLLFSVQPFPDKSRILGVHMKQVACLFCGVVLSTVLLVAGCGGGSSSSTNQPPTTNPSPTIATITPSSVVAGSSDTSVTITGTGFAAGSVVSWNSVALTTTYLSATSLTVNIPAIGILAQECSYGQRGNNHGHGERI